ncbi:hypothetical protein [Caproiciproducens faecalis]|uniref:Uncharacterized protein n=1 Tax=Caproiciproducens faecalis TaxID=2820301 RepID=A0ABS7DQ28_9FIRM|nr:hypothetical protein [Caproiciproducens faecalis]MBW7573224.1 hypothetical protein [Caproiciproducens faecalis]
MDKDISEKIRNMLRELGWSDEAINHSEFFAGGTEPASPKVQAVAKNPEQNRS